MISWMFVLRCVSPVKNLPWFFKSLNLLLYFNDIQGRFSEATSRRLRIHRTHFGNTYCESIRFKNLSLTSKPILFILQRIWDLKNPILKGDILKELFLMGREIKDSAHYKELMKIAVSYVMNYDLTTSWQDLQDVEKKIVPKKGEPIMSLMKSVYQGWKEEGIEEGIEKGMERGREEGKQEGREEGIVIGIEKGREEGKEEGRKEYKSQMAVKMLKKGMKITTICDLTGLSVKDIKKIEKKIQ